MSVLSKAGLMPRDIELIRQAIQKVDRIEKVVLFGSRAKGNYHKGSDIDLAIQGSRVDYEVVNTLADLLNEELPLPYFFDIVDYNSLSAEDLRQHIDRVGQIIYPDFV